MNKIIIYQVFTRFFGNKKTTNKENGTLEENGSGKFNAFSEKTLAEIKSLGATHIWYTGVLAHATKTDYSRYGITRSHAATVKGNAGSPYAVRDYYDVCPDLAENVENRMQEFEALIERTHEAGLKAIIDFVPNHVARQYHSNAKPANVVDLGENDNQNLAFSPQNNFYYIPNQGFESQIDMLAGEAAPYAEFPARATGNDCFHAYPNINDWYETIKLNYGVDYCGGGQRQFNPIPNTWLKIRDILLFWAGKKVDGFRCDMAEMVPVEFWEWAIKEVKAQFPDIIFIAEVYNPAEYRNYIHRGGFDYLYDKVGLYDTLRAITCGYAPASNITHCWQSVNDIQKQMLNFLENHDEQRIASDFFAGNAAAAIPAAIVSATMNTNPFMLYFGQELGERGMDKEGFSGQDGRTTIFDYWNVLSINNWINGGKFDGKKLTGEQKSLQNFYKKLLTISEEKAISEGEFYDLMWLNYENPQFNTAKQYAFLRKKDETLLLVVVNFSDTEKEIVVNIPPAVWKEYFKLSGKQKGKTAELLYNNVEENFSEQVRVNLAAKSGKILKYVF